MQFGDYMNDNEKTLQVSETTSQQDGILRSLGKGLAHLAKVAWTVPAAQSLIATLLIRWGVPSALVTIGVAVGEKLAS